MEAVGESSRYQMPKQAGRQARACKRPEARRPRGTSAASSSGTERSSSTRRRTSLGRRSTSTGQSASDAPDPAGLRRSSQPREAPRTPLPRGAADCRPRRTAARTASERDLWERPRTNCASDHDQSRNAKGTLPFLLFVQIFCCRLVNRFLKAHGHAIA
jgi:hypothetical protein